MLSLNPLFVRWLLQKAERRQMGGGSEIQDPVSSDLPRLQTQVSSRRATAKRTTWGMCLLGSGPCSSRLTTNDRFSWSVASVSWISPIASRKQEKDLFSALWSLLLLKCRFFSLTPFSSLNRYTLRRIFEKNPKTTLVQIHDNFASERGGAFYLDLTVDEEEVIPGNTCPIEFVAGAPKVCNLFKFKLFTKTFLPWITKMFFFEDVQFVLLRF